MKEEGVDIYCTKEEEGPKGVLSRWKERRDRRGKRGAVTLECE